MNKEFAKNLEHAKDIAIDSNDFCNAIGELPEHTELTLKDVIRLALEVNDKKDEIIW